MVFDYCQYVFYLINSLLLLNIANILNCKLKCMFTENRFLGVEEADACFLTNSQLHPLARDDQRLVFPSSVRQEDTRKSWESAPPRPVEVNICCFRALVV